MRSSVSQALSRCGHHETHRNILVHIKSVRLDLIRCCVLDRDNRLEKATTRGTSVKSKLRALHNFSAQLSSVPRIFTVRLNLAPPPAGVFAMKFSRFTLRNYSFNQF